MTSLIALPAELIGQVFLELTSLTDVCALARASSGFNDIFQIEKPRAFAKYVRRAIHPTVLPLAIVACTVFNSDRETLYDIIPYVQNETWTNPKHRETALIKNYESLLRLLYTVQPFVKHFCSQAFTGLNYKRDMSDKLPLKNKEIEGLTESELGRLQRAFIWFEIYRRVHGGFDSRPEDHKSYHFFRSSHRATTVIEHFELYTVEEYLERLVEEVLFKIGRFAEVRAKENKVAADLMTDLVTRESSGESQEDSLNQMEKEAFHSPLFPRNLIIGNIFHNKSRISQAYNGTAAFLIELGLPFCRKFLDEMSLEQQMMAVRLALAHRRILNLRAVNSNDIFSIVFACGLGLSKIPLETNRHTDCLYRDRTFLDLEPADEYVEDEAYGSRQTGFWFWSEDRMIATACGELSSQFLDAKLDELKNMPIDINHSDSCSPQNLLFEDEAGFRKYVAECDYTSNEVVYKSEELKIKLKALVEDR